jgi:hypothetical protein
VGEIKTTVSSERKRLGVEEDPDEWGLLVSEVREKSGVPVRDG